MKKMKIVLPILCLLLGLTACSSNKEQSKNEQNVSIDNSTNKKENVDLIVWCEEDAAEITNTMCESFKEHYKNDVNINITIEPHSEADMKNDILANVNANFDVFSFPDDQFDGLNAAGVLDVIPNSKEIKDRTLENAAVCAEYEGNMYAYPYTADNGYFLYYNKKYFKDEDLKTLDGILKVCNDNNKKMQMNMSSGWYMYSFYGQTGLEFGINPSGLNNHCNWNTKKGDITGLDVAKSIEAFIKNDAFIDCEDGDLINGFKNATIIAGVCGTWVSSKIESILKENYGAIKLPTYTCNGKQIQMATFLGYKMFGVNHYSNNKEWAHKLADWLTNEDNQLLRLQERNQGPANINASNSKLVSQNLAIKAILDESQYGTIQRVGNKYWNACTNFITELGTKEYNDTTLQNLIDKLVDEIEAPVGA